MEKKTTFTFSKHVVKIFTYNIYTSIHYKHCVKDEGYIDKSYHNLKQKLVNECEGTCVMCLLVSGTGRGGGVGSRPSSAFQKIK